MPEKIPNSLDILLAQLSADEISEESSEDSSENGIPLAAKEISGTTSSSDNESSVEEVDESLRSTDEICPASTVTGLNRNTVSLSDYS